MKPKKTSLDILTEARRLIAERGHTHHAYEDSQGCLCATGAIIKAFDPLAGSTVYSQTSYTFKPELKEVGKIFMEANPTVLYEQMPDNLWLCVFRLNDISNKNDILVMFDKAIALAKEKENG